MITALISVYNSMDDGLEGCIKSLSGKCEKLMIADGYYENPRDDERYPYLGSASTDGTLEYCKGLSNADWVDAPETFYQAQVEKWNRMTRQVEDNVWMLLIDPDERMIGNPGSLARSVDYVPVKVVDPDGQVMYYIRLVKKTKGMVWTDWCTVKSPAGIEVSLYLGNISEQVYIEHTRRFRNSPK